MKTKNANKENKKPIQKDLSVGPQKSLSAWQRNGTCDADTPNAESDPGESLETPWPPSFL